MNEKKIFDYILPRMTTADVFPKIYDGFREIDALKIGEDSMLDVLKSTVESAENDKMITTAGLNKISEYERNLEISPSGTIEERRETLVDYISRDRTINDAYILNKAKEVSGIDDIEVNTDCLKLETIVSTEANIEDADNIADILRGTARELLPIVPQNLSLACGVHSQNDIPLTAYHGHLTTIVSNAGLAIYIAPPEHDGVVDFNSAWGKASDYDLSYYEIPRTVPGEGSFTIVKSYSNHNVDNGIATMVINFTIDEEKTIDLYVMNQGETNYDFPTVYLDGTVIGEAKSADKTWRTFNLQMTSGNHRVEIEYKKDGSVSNEPDCAYAALPSNVLTIPDEYAPDPQTTQPPPEPEHMTAYLYTSSYQETGQRQIMGNSSLANAATWVIYSPGTNDAIPVLPDKIYTVTGVFASNGTDLNKHNDCELVNSNGYLKLWFKNDGETIRVNNITYDVADSASGASLAYTEE